MKIAIVGRPNVGKSTLFNRLSRQREALVDKKAGSTRDRRDGTGYIGDLTMAMVDTAGYEDMSDAPLSGLMRGQTEIAVREADLCLFVIDARVGVTPQDARFAQYLRRSGKPVAMVANKCEGRAGGSGIAEAHGLGFGEVAAISAEHGEGLSDLRDVILASAGPDALPDDQTNAEPETSIRLAIIGRPNAGKSTLVNALLGEDRVIAGPEAGMTRDAIDLAWRWKDRSIRLIDTAGLRKKARIVETAEKLSTADALRALRRADIALLTMDADRAYESQDIHLADQALRMGRGMVLVLTKWDNVPAPRQQYRMLEEMAMRMPVTARSAPVCAVSAEKRTGLDAMMTAVCSVHRDWSARIKTRDLNDWLRELIRRHPPPAPGGKHIRPRYIAQTEVQPPRIVLLASRGSLLPESYRRFLIADMRKAFDLAGVPIDLHVREGKNPYARKAR